jgi:hypothetical protein
MTIRVIVDTPRLKASVDRLRFAVVNNGGSASAATQPQQIGIDGIGVDVPWTAVANQPWILLSRSSGTGPSRLSIGIDPGAVQLPFAGQFSGSVEISAPGMPQSPLTIDIELQVYANGTSSSPFGVFETPANGATGLSGAIAATGWVLDDVIVTRVRIYRDPVGAEQSLVYLADAALIPGARPDVRDAFPQFPGRDRAGYGVMILTDMLQSGKRHVHTSRVCGRCGRQRLIAGQFHVFLEQRHRSLDVRHDRQPRTGGDHLGCDTYFWLDPGAPAKLRRSRKRAGLRRWISCRICDLRWHPR